jgi:hypothetical protein
MECFNSQKYRLEHKNYFSENENKKTDIPPIRYHVNEINEKIVLTKKYRIVNARDPNTGITYELNEIIDLNIINTETGMFCLPNTNNLIELDEAIRLGMVNACLIDQQVESSNESFEYFEENNMKISENFNYNKNIRFDVKVSIIVIIMVLVVCGFFCFL